MAAWLLGCSPNTGELWTLYNKNLLSCVRGSMLRALLDYVSILLLDAGSSVLPRLPALGCSLEAHPKRACTLVRTKVGIPEVGTTSGQSQLGVYSPRVHVALDPALYELKGILRR